MDPYQCWSCGIVVERCLVREPHGRRVCCGQCASYAAKKSAIKGARLTHEDRLRRNAHVLTMRLIRQGVIVRKPCEMCGEPDSQAHHDDYSKPTEVRFLCRSHHARVHAEAHRVAMLAWWARHRENAA